MSIDRRIRTPIERVNRYGYAIPQPIDTQKAYSIGYCPGCGTEQTRAPGGHDKSLSWLACRRKGITGESSCSSTLTLTLTLSQQQCVQ